MCTICGPAVAEGASRSSSSCKVTKARTRPSHYHAPCRSPTSYVSASTLQDSEEKVHKETN
ncbi:hypothetical protein BDN71DRAFT_1458311 [Pleurotus eryngii]|uniref:Uncharacterized protein n=1 Tax=Pleurotus eryngii TaxID=5323 RepID=A0A9P5ZI72_PLEER|nr:hypothetical protein BDN71DRAFT_1458311 [Pleurotus eryngii]